MDATNIINTLSRRLVWEKPINLNKAASIYESLLGKASFMKRTPRIRGIGYSLYKKKQYIDFFIPQDYNINWIIKHWAEFYYFIKI